MLLKFREFNVNRLDEVNHIHINPQYVTLVWDRTIDLAYKGLGVVKYCEISTVQGGGAVWDEDRTVAETIAEAMKVFDYPLIVVQQPYSR